MSAERLQKNGLVTVVPHEPKNDPQVVADAARPMTLKAALELVRS